MCYVPGATEIAIASFALSSTQAIIGHMGQQQQAAAMEAQYQQNRTSAISAYQDDNEANSLNMIAQGEAAGQSILQARRDAFAARAAARAAGAERGVGGLSQAAIEQTISAQAGESVAYTQRNLELDQERYRLGGKAAANTALARINSAPRGRKPSVLALAANIGSSAMNAYAMHSGLKADERRTAAEGRT